MYYGFGSGYGRGRGMRSGRGMGFGFRGSSPLWPCVGIGRGGIPRCQAYVGSGASGTPYAPGMAPPPSGAWGMRRDAYGIPYPREEEIRFLKGQAEMIRHELEAIDSRIQELEKGKTQGGGS
jgi:hypothetical protein